MIETYTGLKSVIITQVKCLANRWRGCFCGSLYGQSSKANGLSLMLW